MSESQNYLKVPTGEGKLRADLPRKTKYLTAAVIYYGNVTLGCTVNTYGPALTSFQTKYETDDSTISKVFTVITACYLVGGLTSSFIYKQVNRQFAVILTFGVMSSTVFMVPLCPTLPTFFVAGGVIGLCSGLYDAAQFVWIPEMMQKDCPPFVQGQHFFFALGTNLAGLIMAPFLSSDAELNGSSKLFTPYAIIGCLLVFSMISQQVLYIFMPYHPPPPETIPHEKKQDTKAKWSSPKLRLVILLCCFFGAYLSMEMSTFQFFSKFVQNSKLNLSQSEAAYLLSGMTAAFAVTRGVGIILVLKVSPRLLLCGNIVLTLIANILLIGWAQNSLSVMWAASIIFGIGFSTSIASFTAYIERHLVFTSIIGTFITVSASSVAALYPLILGAFIKDHPAVLCYTIFFSLTVITISFGVASYLTWKDKSRY